MINLNLDKYLSLKAISYYDSKNELKFDPPVYEQRYAAVIKILEHEYWKGKMKKVIDFGCAEMKLLTLLKRVNGVEHILEVDIDESLLKPYVHRAKPLLTDYVARRPKPLRIDVYKGSVDASVNCVKDADAVIAVELIEHLHPDIFERLPFNIFGFIKPKLVVITTPNSEFNVLFELTLANGFRHADHKFEWTRTQFRDWCLNICKRFPNYEVDITGIGKGPPETRKYGCVSQMGVFIRKDIIGKSLTKYSKNDMSLIANNEQNEYNLIFSIEFPYFEDNRSNNEKIFDEARYHIGRYTGMGDRYFNIHKKIHEIPLTLIFNLVYPLAITEDELSTVLLDNGYKIEDNLILMEEEYENDEDDDDETNENVESEATNKNLTSTDYEEENWD